MSGLNIAVSQEGPATVAVIDGEVDLSNSTRFTDELLAQMPDSSSGMVLDLAELRYLDSAGVRSIFEVARVLELRNQALALVVIEGSALRSVLKVTHADEVVSICADREEALEAIATGRPCAE